MAGICLLIEISNMQYSNSVFSKDSRVQRLEASDGTRIYRIQAPVLPWLQGFVYLLLGEKLKPMLIDCGSGEGECPIRIEEGFDTINREFEPFSISDLKRIFLTHVHLDHFGGTQGWKHRSGAELYVHLFESRTVSSYNERAVDLNCRFVTMMREGGVPEEKIPDIINSFGFLPGRISSSVVEHSLEGGETVDNLQFHYLPGHSSGHTAVQLDSFIFSGDLVLSKTLTQVWPERLIPHTGLTHYLQSLDRLEKMAVDYKERTDLNLTALPAHEDIVADIPARIALVRRGEERRNNKLLEILTREDRPMTYYELFKRMYYTTHINRTLFALCDIAGRVEYLQQHGLVMLANYDSIDWMTPTAFRFIPCK